MTALADLDQALALGEEAAHGWAMALPQLKGAQGDGARLGQRAGASHEFQDYRAYGPGDDLRHLDWSVYGRSDQWVVRRFQQEVSPHLDLIVDGSRSMGPLAPSDDAEGSPKAMAAASLAAFLSACAGQGGFSQRRWLAADDWRPIEARGKAGRGDFRGQLDFRGRRSPGALLAYRRPPWRPRGLRCLISDFLWPEEPRSSLSSLAQGAESVVLIQILSREEIEPTLRGFLQLEDSEDSSRQELLIDGFTIAKYKRALERHRQSWQGTCRRFAAHWLSFQAEDVLDAWQARRRGDVAPLLRLLDPLLQSRVLEATAGGR